MSRSHSERILLDKTLMIVQIRLLDTADQPYYAYLALRPQELEKLANASRNGNFNPNEYGTLILAGTGEPPPEAMKFMEEEYGYDHEKGIVLS